MGDLSVQIRHLDLIPVHEANNTYSCAGKICCRRTPESSRANKQDLGVVHSQLALRIISFCIIRLVPWMINKPSSPNPGTIICLP